MRLSDSLIHSHEGDASEPCGIPESDDLGGSARGLKSGYGQSKYVAERLTMLAAQRGLKAAIVRPGYVVGDSQSAVTNTDDFVWRLVKGCTQLGLVPDMHNTINMVPVDHVARITSLAALAAANASPEKKTGAKVYHVTAHPEIRFNGLLGSLAKYGWKVQKTEYVHWRTKLEQHVMGGGADNALFPLVSCSASPPPLLSFPLPSFSIL